MPDMDLQEELEKMEELEKKELENGIVVRVYPIHNEEVTTSQESVVVVAQPLPTAASAAATDEDPTAAPPDRTAPLDGGAIAWAQVIAGFLLNAIAWGYPGTFGVYQLYYTETLGMSSTDVSWIGSVQTFLTYFVCTLSGRLCDAGYTGPTVLAGSSIVLFGTLITSIAHEYWQIFLTQGIITGLGLGLLTCPPVTLVSSYFVRRKSLALAAAAMGSSAGSVVLPAVMQYLLPVIGFAWAIRCVALVTLLFCGNAYILLRPRHKANRSGPWVEWAAFKEPAYLMFAIGTFFLFWALYFGTFFVRFKRSFFVFSPEGDELTPWASDQRLRHRSRRLHANLLRLPPDYHERAGDTDPARPRLRGRPLRRAHKLLRAVDHRPGRHLLGLDGRRLSGGHVRLRRLLRPGQRRLAGLLDQLPG